jgi:hypothetical protein
MIRTIVRCAEHRQRPIAEELVHPVSHHLPEKTLIGVTRPWHAPSASLPHLACDEAGREPRIDDASRIDLLAVPFVAVVGPKSFDDRVLAC